MKGLLYTEAEIIQAGLFKGDEYVDRLKRDNTNDVTSVTSGLSGAAGLTIGVPGTGGTGTVTKTGSETTTPSNLTAKQIAEARAMGDAIGRAHPELTVVIPHGYCDFGSTCNSPAGIASNPDNAKREEFKGSSPKPEAPKQEPTPKEAAPTDPFAPIIKDSNTGGAKTSDGTPKPDAPKEKGKGVSTPVNDPQFASEMNDCVSVEENNILKNEGSKTKDQNAKTDEEKKAEAEEPLSRGICDSLYFGDKFCADWKNEQAKSQAQNAEADKQAAYEEAFKNWQANGICDSMVLGFAFCQNAHSQLVTTPADSENPDTGTIESYQCTFEENSIE
ncbi:MAG: hypothetical protein H7318_06250 [Oligoflexus sp.]|nr:hypothetical protein [Oligoflexus sp.]